MTAAFALSQNRPPCRRRPGMARTPSPRLLSAWPNPESAGIDLGAAVRVSLSSGGLMNEEGVVVHVVPRGEVVHWLGAAGLYTGFRSPVIRYVVQCRDMCVLRRAGEMVVVCL